MTMSYEELEDLRNESGRFETTDKLTAFLYDLMRDHLPPGTVAELVHNSRGEKFQLTNGWLGTYAEYLARKLRREP